MRKLTQGEYISLVIGKKMTEAALDRLNEQWDEMVFDCEDDIKYQEYMRMHIGYTQQLKAAKEELQEARKQFSREELKEMKQQYEIEITRISIK
ncbi:hypothetical protein [Bacillus paramobilis]|uniref:hypothetical protein n=1 Tax=Bacillus paramobilis TaxID=2817477 RepID=UPI001BB40D4A|nr:hypothetical protein [Bacillus paramobilis]HEF5065755.1 hypothetical protein [Bacillus cereus]HEF5237739.1 hypothetical protein [Bacillus cereus]